jgi:hypothetical protein
MKSAAVLCITLSLATLASAAAISLTASKTTVMPGDSVTVSLLTCEGFYSYVVDAIGDGGKGGTASNLWVSSEPPIIVAHWPGWVENTSTCLVSFMDGLTPGDALPAGIDVFHFTYHVSPIVAVGESITIAPLAVGVDFWSEMDQMWFPVVDAPQVVSTLYPDGLDIGGVTLTVVPEPMTVVLVGAGGLLLRRKRG